MKKQAIIALLIVVIFLNMTVSLGADTIYERKSEERISSGVIYKTHEIFTENGWNQIKIIEVDLTNKNTKVGLLNADTGLSKMQNVLQMAQNSEVIAAINADFFNGKGKNGNAIGLSIVDGEVLTSTYGENEASDVYSTFVLNNKDNAWIDYFSNEITLKASTKKDVEISIGEINKYALNYDKPIVYTRSWGETFATETTEMSIAAVIVEDNKVKEIVSEAKEFEIPEDGYVVVAYGTPADYIKENFKKKMKVTLDIEMELDIDKIKLAVSGGTVLVKDGEIPEKFTDNKTGVQPRSALGISEDGKTLYLVAVEGRTSTSVGMTHKELAEYLIEIGSYNAMNFDGGGSTTLVGRRLGRTSLETLNTLSDGSLRNVANAIGVYNTSKASSLYALKLETSEENVFVGSKREVKVYGYDKNYNPVEINASDIVWEISGVQAQVENGIIYAGNDAGTATITARVGKVSGSINIDVLSAPNEILITPKKSTITSGDTVKFEVTAKNKNGYYASLALDELKWEIVSGNGKITNGKFSPSGDGTSILKISKGEIATYAVVDVGENSNIIPPQDVKNQDSSGITENASEDSYKIMICDGLIKENTLLDKLTNQKINNLSGDADKVIVTGTDASNYYSYSENNNVAYITIDVSNGGLRKTESTAWNKLKNGIRNSTAKNILIVMKGNLDSFTDSRERKLFIDVICELRNKTGKTIWVICDGNYTDYSMERGTKYLTVNNKNINYDDGFAIIQNMKYILITIENDKMTYEIKNIL